MAHVTGDARVSAEQVRAASHVDEQPVAPVDRNDGRPAQAPVCEAFECGRIVIGGRRGGQQPRDHRARIGVALAALEPCCMRGGVERGQLNTVPAAFDKREGVRLACDLMNWPSAVTSGPVAFHRP